MNRVDLNYQVSSQEVIAKGGKRQSIRLANNDDVHFWAEWRQTGQQYISRIANDTDGVEKEGGVASLNQLIGRLTNSTVFCEYGFDGFLRAILFLVIFLLAPIAYVCRHTQRGKFRSLLFGRSPPSPVHQ